MRNRKAILIVIIGIIISSCGIDKTHHKNELIDFEKNKIPYQSLKLNGYYFTELERDAIDAYYIKTGIKKIKYLSVFFIYEDGFAINIDRVDGLSDYHCAKKETYENTYESAHRTVELMLESQNLKEKRIKRICGFKPTDISNKGLAKINKERIKIQFYRAEMQNPEKDSFNSYYLNEMNGIIKSDSSFAINSVTEFKNNKTTSENKLFKFRQTDQKPNIENYFKKNINQFK